jgi:anti-anti-sigma regulatory factor
MGLHAKIHQRDHEVSIALSGEFNDTEYLQLAEIIKHFRNRGCQALSLDLKGIVDMSAAERAYVRKLLGQRDQSDKSTIISAPSASVRIPPQSGRRRAAGLLFSDIEVTDF